MRIIRSKFKDDSGINTGTPSGFTMTLFILLTHLILFMVCGYGLMYDVFFIRLVLGRSYGGPWKYLTFWSEILQTLYYGVCLLNDLFGSNLKPGYNQKKRSFLQRLRDNLVACIVWPVGTFVVITFWGIYAIDRELVFPKALDGIIPAWLNHIMHSTVLLFLLVDKCLVYHHYPSVAVGLSATLAFGLMYAAWILWVAYAANIWVYPILEVMNWGQRFIFLVGLWMSLSLIYMAGHNVTTLIWGSPRKTIVKKRD